MDDNKIEIIPGILEKEWEEIEKKLEAIKTFAKSAHIDIIDGKFVDNLTYLNLASFKPFSSDLFLEAHLMVENPIEYLKPLADAGFKRFIGHIEKMPDIAEFVALGQMLGEVGLALDGPTELELLDNTNMDDLDCVLIMTIKAGRSGQDFMPEHLEKVRKLCEKTSIPIEIDGGINNSTIVTGRESGATRFVATSFIWNSDNPKEAFEKLKDLL
jgi:ribulose-phosphate 3-epimerase